MFEDNELLELYLKAFEEAGEESTIDLTAFSKYFIDESIRSYEHDLSFHGDPQEGYVGQSEYIHYTLKWLALIIDKNPSDNGKKCITWTPSSYGWGVIGKPSYASVVSGMKPTIVSGKRFNYIIPQSMRDLVKEFRCTEYLDKITSL